MIGSDGLGNIGAHIARALGKTMPNVSEIDRPTMDLSKEDYPFVINDDVLVLANGHSYMDWIEDIPEDQIKRVLDDVLLCSIRMTQQFVKATIDSNHKKYIVFIGSMAYQGVLNGSSVYCAAKAGISHFMRCVAWELAPKGYSVFCVNPSNTEGTPMTEETILGLMRYRNISRSDAEQYWGAVLPKEQWLQPEEIADTVAFLVSGKADYLSGSNLNMAGGQR